MFNYKMPDEIKNKIPTYFYAALIGELFSVYGMVIFDRDNHDTYGLSYLTSTSGWNEALYATCNKLNMKWLWEYYDSLEWYESDIFDGEIEFILIDQILTEENKSFNNSYYEYLLRKNNEFD